MTHLARPTNQLVIQVVAIKTLSKLRQLFDSLYSPLLKCSALVVDQGFYSLTSFLTGVILARTLQKDEYGVYVLALSVALTVMGIQRAVITTPHTVNSYKDIGERTRYHIGSICIHQTLILCICAAFPPLITAVWTNGHTSLYSIFALSIGILVFFLGVLARDFVRSLLLTKLDIQTSVYLGLVTNLFQISLLLLVYFESVVNIFTVFAIIGTCSLAASLIAFAITFKPRFSIAYVMIDFRQNYKLGRWILGSTLAYSLSTQTYAWLVAVLTDSSSVAVLGVTTSLANAFSPVVLGINSYLFPKMVHARQGQSPLAIARLTRKAIGVLSIVFGVWLILGIYIGDDMLRFVFSDKYAGHKWILVILILNGYASAVTNPINAALDSLERSDLAFKSLLGALVVTCLMGWILIGRCGVYGAAIGILLSNLANCLVRWFGFIAIVNKLKMNSSDDWLTRISKLFQRRLFG